MKLDFTDAARSDLRSIRAYTLERWGEDQERVYLDALWAKFETIAYDPSIWKFRHDLFPECQIATEGKHVILFCIQDDVLQIVRVLHSAMDFRRHVPPRLEDC